MMRTLLLIAPIALIPIADDPAPPPPVTTFRVVTIAWEPGPGWPSDLTSQYPEIPFQVLVNSAMNDPSVSACVSPSATYMTNGVATYTSPAPVTATINWGAIVMAGSRQFACYESNRLYKVTWTGMQITLAGDVDQANLQTQITVEYIGTPPVF